MDPVLELEDVALSPGGTPVLRGVNLVVERGEFVGISGPNGVGKSTLVRAAASLLMPSSGIAKLFGVDVTSSEVASVRTQLALITHQPAIVPNLSLEENLVHTARLAGADDSRVVPVLEVVGLSRARDRRAANSSFGMQRRLELAGVILRRPFFLLLDEATTGLDSEAAELIGAVTGDVVQRGGAVLMVSHDRSDLSTRSDRTLSLQNGSLVEQK